MTTRIGVQGIWEVQHVDANGNPKGERVQTLNHWTRRGAIEIFERVHLSTVAIDPLGGPTSSLFLGSFNPEFALVAKDPIPSYHRADRLGWYRSVGDGVRARNFSWTCVGAGPSSWGDAFTHSWSNPIGPGPDVNDRIHRKKAGSDDHELTVNDITSNLADKQTSYRFTAARRSLVDYNDSYGPSIWHNHGGFPSSGSPPPNIAFPNPTPGLGDIWVPLALGKWSDYPNHIIEGGAGDKVDIFYTIAFNLTFL